VKKIILIVEDEIKIAEVMVLYLKDAGWDTHHVMDGKTVIPWIAVKKPSLIILDLMLVGCDGMTLCKEIRRMYDIPIIIITARGTEVDRLTGFENGADDYICKPFSPKEMVARVAVLMRRASKVIRDKVIDEIMLDRETYMAEANGCKVLLTALEFEIMHVLMFSPGRIFSRDEIMDRAYKDFRIVNDRTIDSHVKKLRRKLDQLKLNKKTLQSVYGIGYKYEV